MKTAGVRDVKGCSTVGGRRMMYLKNAGVRAVKGCRTVGGRRIMYLKTAGVGVIGHQYNTVNAVKSIQHISYIIMYNTLFHAPTT